MRTPAKTVPRRSQPRSHVATTMARLRMLPTSGVEEVALRAFEQHEKLARFCYVLYGQARLGHVEVEQSDVLHAKEREAVQLGARDRESARAKRTFEAFRVAMKMEPTPDPARFVESLAARERHNGRT